MCLTPRIANNISLTRQRNMYYKYKTWQVNLLYLFTYLQWLIFAVFLYSFQGNHTHKDHLAHKSQTPVVKDVRSRIQDHERMGESLVFIFELQSRI